MKLILLIKIFLGLVEMTSRLVKCWLQLARMASCKNDFLCTLTPLKKQLNISELAKFETDMSIVSKDMAPQSHGNLQ